MEIKTILMVNLAIWKFFMMIESNELIQYLRKGSIN